MTKKIIDNLYYKRECPQTEFKVLCLWRQRCLVKQGCKKIRFISFIYFNQDYESGEREREKERKRKRKKKKERMRHKEKERKKANTERKRQKQRERKSWTRAGLGYPTCL